jgi:hypothetical protein
MLSSIEFDSFTALTLDGFFQCKETPKYLIDNLPSLQPKICAKWKDWVEENFKGISSDFVKLTLSQDIPSNVINNHFRFFTILIKYHLHTKVFWVKVSNKYPQLTKSNAF